MIGNAVPVGMAGSLRGADGVVCEQQREAA